MELFFPEISTTTFLSRLRTRSGRKALGIELLPHSRHFDVGRGSCGPMITASPPSTANSALQPVHLTEDQSTILQSRSAEMPYQLSEVRKDVSAPVWPILNSE